MTTPRPSRFWLPVLAALVVIVPALVEFYTDWLWFGEIGYQQVFLRRPGAPRPRSPASIFASAFLFLFVNCARWRSATLRAPAVHDPDRDGPRAIVVEPRSCGSSWSTSPPAGALLLGLYAGSRWEAWLLYRYATPFGDRRSHPRPRRRLLRLQAAVPRAGCRRWLLLALLLATLGGAGRVRERRGGQPSGSSPAGVFVARRPLAPSLGARGGLCWWCSPSAPGWRSRDC